MTIKEIFPYAGEGDEACFRVASGTVGPGDFVYIDSDSKITKNTDDSKPVIGQVMFDQGHTAVNDYSYYTTSHLVPVKLNSKARKVISSGTFNAGEYVKFGSLGKVIVDSSPGTTTFAVAIESASTGDSEVTIVPTMR